MRFNRLAVTSFTAVTFTALLLAEQGSRSPAADPRSYRRDPTYRRPPPPPIAGLRTPGPPAFYPTYLEMEMLSM